MENIAHKREDGKEQPLADHLIQVAEMASVFAEPFGAGEHAYKAGLLHDIGKYTKKGQQRMRDPEHTAKVDHSTAGAAIAQAELKDLVVSLIVAGHHSGLMNMGTKLGAAAHDGTLWGRLKGDYEKDFEEFRREIQIDPSNNTPAWTKNDAYTASFYVRMLYSCLVDADYLDTERFMQNTERAMYDEDIIQRMLERLMEYIKDWFPAKNDLNAKRCEILENCLNGAQYPRGLYTLTVPTGGGKTVSSLAFALSHAAKHGQKRIIYVIPYTSIIEQNADVFAKIVGEENVLEHHSGVDLPETEDLEDALQKRKRMATENWDAPVIVTTAVQFFESLFASKSSRCRKLHNIANSVVIFDEAQMLPLPYLKPCVNAIAELVRHYRVTAILCTATQPSLGSLFADFDRSLNATEINKDPAELTEFFKRVKIEQAGILSNDDLAERLSEKKQVLCIVNSRKRAQNVYEKLPAQGSYHLSTWMTPNHRRAVLSKIRHKLQTGETCRVISTSLIEAGVDVDFPEVWREEGGLDSIIQAAGRCNREGKRDREASTVYVFKGESGVPMLFRQQTEAMYIALEQCGALDTQEAMTAYYEALLLFKGDNIDQKGIIEKCSAMRFRDIAESFHLIENDTINVYIPTEENGDLLMQLRQDNYGKSMLRRLQRDAVSIYKEQYDELLRGGCLEITKSGFAILQDMKCYDSESRGLVVETEEGKGFML